jgi:DNA-binding CsgD family transcriptional regulator
MLDPKALFRLTDYIVALHEAKTFEQMNGAVHAGLAELVPVDAVYVGLWPVSSPGKATSALNAQAAPLVEEFTRLSARFQIEDPFHTGRLRLTLDGAAPIHRLIEPRTLERTSLYNEVWRPYRIRHVLRSANPGKYSLAFWLARTSNRAFNDAETNVLDVFSKQMNASLSKLINKHNGKLPALGQDVAVEVHSWLVCDCTGAIMRSTPDSLEHLRACLGPSASTKQVPPSWHRIYLSRMSGGEPDPREYRLPHRTITAHVAPIKASPGEFTVFFVEQILEADPLASLLKLGLTNREAEVMKWMIEGKTNPEIGIIMGITPLTAKKHVENIRIKLNAPNRTAAVALVMEKLRA